MGALTSQAPPLDPLSSVPNVLQCESMELCHARRILTILSGYADMMLFIRRMEYVFFVLQYGLT